MKTIYEKITELRDRFANMFKQEAIRKNGTATKEYLDHLEAYVVTHDSSCKGCRNITTAFMILTVTVAEDIVLIYMRRSR